MIYPRGSNRYYPTNDRGRGAFYIPNSVTVLSTDQVSTLSKMSITFDLEKEDEKKKLQSMMSFIKMYDCSA